MQCEVEDCKREAKTHKYGNLCLLHYKRYQRHGNTNNSRPIYEEELHKRREYRENTKCKYCNRNIGKCGAKGMCNKHYQMWRKWGDALHFDERIRPTSHGYYRTGKKGQHEHRKIYENYIGRKLKPTEVVHHIDFNKTNNNIENLWLYSSKSEHTRQHCNYKRLQKQLKDNEVIKFKDGIYYKTKL